MSTFYTFTNVTTRKPHGCAYCHRPIAVGAKAEMSSGRFDGQFFRSYLHDACARAAHHGDYEDGLPMAGELLVEEYLSEYREAGVLDQVKAFWPTIEEDAAN